MGDKYINSLQIEKLGHKIQEIRERALRNIVSKLNSGVLFDNDLARSKELLDKLIKWFLFEPCSDEDIVLALIKRILKSQSGQILTEHIGKQVILNELKNINKYLEPKFVPLLEDIIEEISTLEKNAVPPLECDVPLSYRSGTSVVQNNYSAHIKSTATTQEGFLHKESSTEQQTGVQKLSESTISTVYENSPTYRIEEIDSSDELPNLYFDWQPLIESDRHVLNSVESSLINPPQPSSLLHSCEFFRDVLLHDFPAEIFLQRPKIVSEFFALLNYGSFRITNSVFSCLYNLTIELQTRINHCNDVSMHNFKLKSIIESGFPSSPLSEDNRKSENDFMVQFSDQFENQEEVKKHKHNQISTLKYCLFTIDAIFEYLCSKQTKKKKNQVATNFCLVLLEKILGLLNLCVGKQSLLTMRSETSLKLPNDVNKILIKYGTALEHFRIESISSENNLKCRATYLYLLHNCANLLEKLVPLSKSSTVLPKNFKTALANSLLDVTFSRLYPTVHNKILTYVENFSEGEDKFHLKKYEDVKKICQGMSATVQILKEYKNLAISENIRLASDSVASIEFHKNFDFLKVYVDVSAKYFPQIYNDTSKTDIFEEVTLRLLNHAMMDIRQEMYRLCHKMIVAYIGPKINDTTGIVGSQVLFLLRAKILVEISCFGLNCDNLEIQKYSEEILTYILKCKILVSDSVWNKVIQALIPSLPIITCQVSKNSILGKAVLSLADPDIAKESLLPTVTMVKCNVEFLFLDDPHWKEEAFSRICWLLSSQENARELLPGFNTLYDTSLTGICKVKKIVDINKFRRTDHFYQPSSLYQVLDVLNSTNVEPVIKRSALNQISVMLEDPLLHQLFLDANGLSLMLNIMKTAITEKDYRDYPDSIIPVISIIKNLALYHASVREELSTDVDMFYFVMRGLLLFFTEERFKQDAITLLLLLIFKDFIYGTPSRASFSLPQIIVSRINLPFSCHSHWTISEYTEASLRESITSDRWCLSSIQIQWNAEIFGGFNQLMKWDEICYEDHPFYNFVDILKLNKYDLQCIKNSSIDYCIKLYLTTIQNATSHDMALESIDNLTLYMYLHQLAFQLNDTYKKEDFLNYQWDQTFLRFLNVLPSSENDTIILKKVLQFLSILMSYYPSSDVSCWITNFLKNSNHCIFDLLNIENTTDEDIKIVAQELLKLITVCVKQEQQYLDYYLPVQEKTKSWIGVVKIIATNLKNCTRQHFYNLAYLDSLLSCLAHLTASLGWSDSRPNAAPKEPIPQMIISLCDLVKAFHSGKGPTAAVSVMGLSITRHVVLVLNHILAEIKNAKIKEWEPCFFDYIDDSPLYSFVALWASRDIVLRAASLQLFAGLTSSPRAAIEVVHGLTVDSYSIWDLALKVLTDHTEASAVRENAAELLANLTSHSCPLGSDKSNATCNYALKKSTSMTLLNLIDEYNFYDNTEIILNDLFTMNLPSRRFKNVEKIHMQRNNSDTEQSWTTSSCDTNIIRNFVDTITTPSLVTSLCHFLYNCIALDSESVTQKIQEQGLTKLLFRALHDTNINITNTRELSLYCDLLDMDTTICCVLSRLASTNSTCLGTILHTKDCLNLLLSLLNPRLYHMNFPQLIYLRNRLWTSIFNLLIVLVECSRESSEKSTDRSIEVINIFTDTIADLGNGPFFETICESISTLGSHDLQKSALNLLTCLLRIEAYRFFEFANLTETDSDTSIRHLLDSVQTSRTIVISNNSNKDLTKNSKKSLETYKLNLLEEIYYEKVFPIPENNNDEIEVTIVENPNEGLTLGAELCKILLYLYDICDLKENDVINSKKSIVTKTLSTLLSISKEAKKFALEKGMVVVILKSLRNHHIRLGLESVECLRRIADRKRLCPLLKELEDSICLLTNFMIDYEPVKVEAASLNLADVVHKLWIWFLVQNGMLLRVLKLICTFTTNCDIACQSLPLTSPVAGGGPRKSPGTVSLLHAIMGLINREMDQISKSHDRNILELSFNILHNSCQSLECRVLISKSNLFQSISRLHPAITKRQTPWEHIELIWLDFLQTFTAHPEGQASIAKIPDVLELILTLTNSSKMKNKLMALLVLRNLAFYQPNKARLLGSAEFLNVLLTKLSNGSDQEKNTVVIIMWALAANSQKAKIILKSVHLDDKLQNVIKHCQLLKTKESVLNAEDIDRMFYVLGLLRDNNDKIR
ncbi:rotatin-like isoform X1 [Diorhabda sublineata]|uniref:rotatin-like isoform X1 n=1 Tax=Diorhabda sublineata TaxID=1163346 RepID=UPI0024E15004|nr:rotatin-like isoform X1 [Diorhabda sublineata]